VARLVVEASRRGQVWLVTHSDALAVAVAASGEGAVRTVLRRDGATAIGGLSRLGGFTDDD
jgi:predicted ATPase